MGQCGCGGRFVGERYEDKEFFYGVPRENGSMFYLARQIIILGTLHGRGETPNTATPRPCLSIDVHDPTLRTGHRIRFSLYPRTEEASHQRGQPVTSTSRRRTSAFLSGETLLVPNLPGLLVLRAYAVVREEMF
jgi:hypothetical protein